MSLTIRAYSELTLRELEKLARSQPMYMTPHIGNLDRAEMIAARLGCRLALYPCMTLADHHYAPGRLVTSECDDSITTSPNGTLVPCSTLCIGAKNDSELVQRGTTPAQIHYHAARAVFGEMVTLTSDTIYGSPIAQRIIDDLLKAEQLWRMEDRRSIGGYMEPFSVSRDAVDMNGQRVHVPMSLENDTEEVHRSLVETQRAISRAILNGDSAKCIYGGRLPTNEINIVLLAALGAVHTQQNVVYTVSQAGMIDYMRGKDFLRKLNAAYASIPHGKYGLPKDIELQVIPGEVLNLLPYADDQRYHELWDELVSLILNYRDTAGQARNSEAARRAMKNLELIINQKIAALVPILANRKKLSQHDLYRNGKLASLSDGSQLLTMKELQMVHSKIRKHMPADISNLPSRGVIPSFDSVGF